MKWLIVAASILFGSGVAEAQVGPVSSCGVVLGPNSAISLATIGPSGSPCSGIPTWVLQPGGNVANIDMDFADGLYFGATPANLTVTRTGNAATNLLPTSAQGFVYTTFAANTARITGGLGLLVEEARTNFLLNSAVPATQTTGTLANGTYTLWVNGAGTATMSSGTATGCGTSTASQGTPISFTLTGTTGTCVVTVSGSLNAFQLELNPGTVSNPTSLIVTGGTTVTRNADAISLSGLTFGSAFTLYGSGTPSSPTTYANSQDVLQVDDTTTNNRAFLRRFAGSGQAGWGDIVSGSVLFSTGFAVGSPAWAQNTFGKVAGSYAAGAQNAQFNNGTASDTRTAASVPAPTVLKIGGDTSSVDYYDGYVARVALWLSTALTVTQNQTITAGSGP